MMRGALACMPPWRLGALPEFPPYVDVDQAVLAQRDYRQTERRVGVAPGTGIPVCRGKGL